MHHTDASPLPSFPSAPRLVTPDRLEAFPLADLRVRGQSYRPVRPARLWHRLLGVLLASKRRLSRPSIPPYPHTHDPCSAGSACLPRLLKSMVLVLAPASLDPYPYPFVESKHAVPFSFGLLLDQNVLFHSALASCRSTEASARVEGPAIVIETAASTCSALIPVPTDTIRADTGSGRLSESPLSNRATLTRHWCQVGLPQESSMPSPR